jgi:hypothetical protein
MFFSDFGRDEFVIVLGSIYCFLLFEKDNKNQMSHIDYKQSFNAIFRNPNYTELLQLISAFALGIILSPWSWGFLFFILYVVLYEIAIAIVNHMQYPYWRLEFRCAIVCASVFGFIIGRSLIGYEDPFIDEPGTKLLVVRTVDISRP